MLIAYNSCATASGLPTRPFFSFFLSLNLLLLISPISPITPSSHLTFSSSSFLTSACGRFLSPTLQIGLMGMPEDEAEIDRLPLDLLSYILSFLTSFRCLGRASLVCRKWRKGVDRSYARNERLSFTGWSINDDSTARLVGLAYNLKDLDISRSCWGCRITDDGLYKISFAKCVSNLTSISLWGMTGITDKGVIVLVSKAISLQHLNIGGTFITDESLLAIADNCPQLKSIVLWSCRHVSGSGLVTLVNICRRLESINAWGMRVSGDCFASLLTINPGLRIKSGEMHLNVGPVPFWP